MTQIFRRAAAIVLSAALLATTVFASYALGDELYASTVRLAQGATLTTQTFWSNSKSDLRTENYITYTPGQTLSPKVSYGSNVLSKGTVTSMAQSLEAQGKRVLSGINGDFFVMATGDPLGIVITDGTLRSSASHLSAVGFNRDGTAVIGKPDLSLTAVFRGNALKMSGINKVRSSDGAFYLLTDDFSSTTQNTQPGVDVVLAPAAGASAGTVAASHDGSAQLTVSNTLKVGGKIPCVVEGVYQSTGSISIPQGKFVMTINSKSDAWLVSEAAALQPGDPVDLEITSPDARWNTVDCALGAMNVLLTDGVVQSGLNTATNPQTAVGVKADGTVLFYTIDGRQSGHSVGATLTMVANRMAELGCVNAVALDGGGSTTLGATMPDSNGFTVSNTPSDGAQRAVSNALFLVSNTQATGVPGSLYVKTKDPLVLAGASTTTAASFVDTGWYPMNSSEPVTWSAQLGSLSDAGVYTAPASGGTDTITAYSGNVNGSTTVTVIQTPTAIRLTNAATGGTISSLTLHAGQTVSLNATATYQTLPVAAGNANFTWNVDSSLGAITADGKFTAGNASGSGSLTITAGGHTASIPVTISADSHYNLLEDFESEGLAEFSDTATCTLDQDTASDHVKFGGKSLRLDYTLSNGTAQATCDLSLIAGDRSLGLWVYGDNSGNTLQATAWDGVSSTQTFPLTTLNFTGWKQVWGTLPDGVNVLTGLSISGSHSSGSIWIDQLLTSNQSAGDTTAPTVSLNATKTSVTATVSDNADTTFGESQLSLTVDGREQDFTLSGNTLSAALSGLDDSLHRITVTATDASGNIGRASKTLEAASNATSFKDMSGHWAVSYTSRLSDLGIIAGVQTNQGLYFYPSQSITRGDFALMTARWMGLDLDHFSSVTLPFADNSSIPSWDLPAVKAMYSLGIMKGTQSGGKLYANAASPISRAEAMTLLGRIQPKGYTPAALTQFSDNGSIPSWSSEYVASLVGQGVVSGYSGLLRPNDSVSRSEVAKMLMTIW